MADDLQQEHFKISKIVYKSMKMLQCEISEILVATPDVITIILTFIVGKTYMYTKSERKPSFR